MSRKRKIGSSTLNNFAVDTTCKRLEQIKGFLVPGALYRIRTACTVWEYVDAWFEVSHKWGLLGTQNYKKGEVYTVLDSETVLMVLDVPVLKISKEHFDLSVFACQILVNDHKWNLVLAKNVNLETVKNMFSKIETSCLNNDREEENACNNNSWSTSWRRGERKDH